MEQTPWDPEGLPVALDPTGRVHHEAALAALDMRQAYRRMVLARAFDRRLARVAPPMFVPSAGDEAIIAAVLAQLKDDDTLCPSQRDHALGYLRGIEIEECLRQILQRSPTSAQLFSGTGTSSLAHAIFPPLESIGMSVALAAGAAQAHRLARSSRVAIALCGEGLTTTGAFHETLALAVRCELPLVIVVKSRTWLDEIPAEAGVMGDDLASRAAGLGLSSARCDGADLLAVHQSITRAVDRARDGQGASLVEVVVTPIRDEVPARRDPIDRVRRWLDASGQWTQTFHDVTEAELRTNFDRALSRIESEVTP